MTSPEPSDQFAPKRAAPQPGDAAKKAKQPSPREATPLVRVRAENWPPEGLSKKERAKLQALMVRDFERTLDGLGEQCGPMRAMFAAGAPADEGAGGTDGDLAASTGTPARPVDCRMTGWGYEIIEIDSITVRARVEYYECTDGTTYRKEYPL
jgi:hypothetical protein